MALIKTKEEISKIKQSGKIAKIIKLELKKMIKPNVTGQDLEKHFDERLIDLKVQATFKNYLGYKHSICVSINDDLIHGIPNQTKFKLGDIIKVDLGVNYQGYHTDTAFTVGLAPISLQDQKVIETAKDAFFAGLKMIKPGAKIGDISHAIGKLVKSRNLFVPKNYSGHGIGANLHEEPFIFNEGRINTGIAICDNMVLAIEPMILQKSARVHTLSDGWTVKANSKLNSSHYEETILIKDGYPIILT